MDVQKSAASWRLSPQVEDLLKKQEAMFEHSIRQEKEHYKEKKLRK